MNLKSENQESWTEAPWWGEYVAQYREALKFAIGARALDVGCGFGFGTRSLFDNGAIEAVGIDIDEEQIAFARKNFGRDGVEFKVQKAENMDFPSRRFDLVTCFQVLEKSVNPDAIVASISRILDKNGIAVISTVNRFRYSKLYDSPMEKAHLIEFDQTELHDLLKRHFAKIEIGGLCCTRDPDSFIFKNPITEKIPHFVRNAVTQKVLGQTYFPSDSEFILKSADSTGASAEAPLFYVVCKKS